MALREQPPEARESPVLRLRPHAVVFARAVAWLACAAMLFGLAAAAADFLFALAGGLFAAAALIAGVDAALKRATTELTITDRRLLLTSGVLNRSYCEIFLPAIAGLELRRGPAGRLLGYGWLRIRGLGDGARWLPVADAEEVWGRIEALATESHAPREAQAPEPPAPPSQARFTVIERAESQPRHRANGDARTEAESAREPSLRPLAERDRI